MSSPTSKYQSSASSDASYMIQAIQLARQGRYTTAPNPCVGCVLVKDQQVIGSGWHIRAGGPHAEIYALRAAGAKSKGATAYVSLEPCSHHGRTGPCCDALIKAGVAQVFVATQDPNPKVSGSGVERMRAAGIKVHIGLLEDEAKALNRGYNSRMQYRKPLVISKIAVSMDGRTAMGSGESQWITGPEARADAQKLRAESAIVMTGAGTVRQDDCALTVRTEDWTGIYLPASCEDQTVRQPLRMMVAGKNAIDPQAKLFTPQAPTMVVSNQEAPEWLPSHIPFQRIPNDVNGNIDFEALLSYCAQDHEANQVLVEAGASLNGAMLAAACIDELHVYMAPKLLGSDARPLAQLGLSRMDEQIALETLDVRQIGQDLKIILRVSKQ